MTNHQDPIRAAVRAWLAATEWSIPQLLRGIKASSYHSVSEHYFREWLAGATISNTHVRGIRDFLAAYPDPGAFDAWEHVVASQARERLYRENDVLNQQRAETERERRERVAALIAEERRPRPRTGIFPSAKWLGGARG